MSWRSTKVQSSHLSTSGANGERGTLNFSCASTHLNFFLNFLNFIQLCLKRMHLALGIIRRLNYSFTILLQIKLFLRRGSRTPSVASSMTSNSPSRGRGGAGSSRGETPTPTGKLITREDLRRMNSKSPKATGRKKPVTSSSYSRASIPMS